MVVNKYYREEIIKRLRYSFRIGVSSIAGIKPGYFNPHYPLSPHADAYAIASDWRRVSTHILEASKSVHKSYANGGR